MKTLVTIATYASPKTAYFLKEHLEKEDIDCFFAFTSGTVKIANEVQVQVRAEEVQKAIRIMMGIKDTYGKNIEEIETYKIVRKILVPVDFSRGSENACYYAVHLAQKLSAEIKILHVFENPMPDVHLKETATLEMFSMRLLREAERKASSEMVSFKQRIKEYMTEQGIVGVNVHSSSIMGHIVTRIEGISSIYHPDLIVLGSASKLEHSDSILAGVANEIIRNLNIPVFAIPGPFTPGILEKMNVLYATDFNEKDHTSLNQLLTILSPFEKRITCIHVDSEYNPANEARMDELNRFLNKAYSQQHITCRLIEDEDVVHGIKSFTEEGTINLLSFTTQKQGIFKKLFKPNLLKMILQEANIPILIFSA